MTKKKKTNRGAPTKFNRAYIQQAYDLCVKGAIDTELAAFFKVHPSTIYQWQLDFPDFSEAIKAGKAISDFEVKSALRKRAMGYDAPHEHITNNKGEITITDTFKHVPPDTAAAYIWLQHRDPENWGKHKLQDGSQDDNESYEFNITVNKVTKPKDDTEE